MEFDLTNLKPDVRKLNDMRDILADKEFAKNSPDMDLYYMYRGLEKKDELRYDITVIPAQMLGFEFTKTKGHFHVGHFQELYIVLEGSAIFLMQKLNENENIVDTYTVKANKGESIIIPSNYGHITINPDKEKDLKMANWMCDNCKSDYSLFEKMHGACYYYTLNGWIKNENYKEVPELRFENPLKEVPQDLNFLK